MSKCKFCNSNLGLFSNKHYCNYCKQNTIMKITNIQNSNKLLNNDLNKKGKKISYYLEIFNALIELQKEVEAIHYMAPDILTECETTEQYIKRVNKNILNFINEQIQIILEKNSLDKNEKEIYKDFKKLYEEVSEAKIMYSEFSEVLSECQEKIKEQLIEENKKQ